MKRVVNTVGVGAAKKAMDVEDIWRLQLERIREMRQTEDAPVDTMGCHMLADETAAPEVQRYQVLLALMLSSQTKDEITAGAMMRLKEHGCSVSNILATPQAELEKLIYPVGFYKKKAVYIHSATRILSEQHNGDVPATLEQLTALPGVGPKMGNLVLQIAWDRLDGIAVDTHVHRIANRLGWMKTSTPEKTRERLQEMLPRDEWRGINPLLVGFGQQRCLPVRPRCLDCLCRELCPEGSKVKPAKNVTVKTEVKVEVKVEIKEEPLEEKEEETEQNMVKQELLGEEIVEQTVKKEPLEEEQMDKEEEKKVEKDVEQEPRRSRRIRTEIKKEE